MNQAPLSDDLLVAYLLNEVNAEERVQVEAALAVSPETQQRMEQYRTLLEQSLAASKPPAVDADAAWKRFEERVARTMPAKPRLGWLRIAALIVLLTGLGLLARQFFGRKEINQAVAASGASPVRTTLPDGSVIMLNHDSRLHYPERFGGTSREVSLEGEAFFSVTPDKSKPFVIRVNDVLVTVVGTSFNIRAQGGKTEVVVETGIVRVQHGRREVTLHPSERVKVGAGDTALQVARAADRLHDYYRSGEFVCDNTPLWRLVEILNEAYGSTIVIDRPEIRNLPLTATFRNESLDSLLAVVATTFNLEVVRSGSIIHLR
ncbi:MAG: DUF4974 domain-containing protein [Chitinophagaceae bacterium]|nr:MAG: DUF4974 domain-containing protein [Chitinophagaceae bacterium]